MLKPITTGFGFGCARPHLSTIRVYGGCLFDRVLGGSPLINGPGHGADLRYVVFVFYMIGYIIEHMRRLSGTSATNLCER